MITSKTHDNTTNVSVQKVNKLYVIMHGYHGFKYDPSEHSYFIERTYAEMRLNQLQSRQDSDESYWLIDRNITGDPSIVCEHCLGISVQDDLTLLITDKSQWLCECCLENSMITEDEHTAQTEEFAKRWEESYANKV
jgi:hypothetical protein